MLTTKSSHPVLFFLANWASQKPRIQKSYMALAVLPPHQVLFEWVFTSHGLSWVFALLQLPTAGVTHLSLLFLWYQSLYCSLCFRSWPAALSLLHTANRVILKQIQSCYFFIWNYSKVACCLRNKVRSGTIFQGRYFLVPGIPRIFLPPPLAVLRSGGGSVPYPWEPWLLPPCESSLLL